MDFSLKLIILTSIIQFGYSRRLSIPKDRYSENGTNWMKPSRSFRVFGAKYRPYFYDDNDDHTHKGIEYMLVKTISEELNISISFQSISRENLSFHWNLTSQFDIGIAGLFPHLHYNQNVVSSTPYFQDKLTWCIQRAGKIPIWVNFFFIIPLNFWIFFALVSVLLCSILVFLLAAFDESYRGKIQQYDFFYCLLLVVVPSYASTSSKFRPLNPRIRIFYCMLLICPWFFHTMIGAFLYQFMNYQFYYHQVTSTQEMLKKNFHLSGSQEVLNAIKFNKMYNQEMVERFHECHNIDLCLSNLKRPENYKKAVGDSRLHLLSSASYSSADIHCFDESESVLTYQVALLLKRESKFEPKINQIILRLSESGFFMKWSKSYSRNQHIDSVQIPTQMKVSNLLMPIIFILGIGIPTALTIFLLELIVFGKTKKNRNSRIWHRVHLILQPERSYLRME